MTTDKPSKYELQQEWWYGIVEIVLQVDLILWWLFKKKIHINYRHGVDGD